MNFGPEEREAYEEYLKWLRIEANTLKKHEIKGFVEGKKIGIVKGREEEKHNIAPKLLQAGMKVEAVCEITGLFC